MRGSSHFLLPFSVCFLCVADMWSLGFLLLRPSALHSLLLWTQVKINVLELLLPMVFITATWMSSPSLSWHLLLLATEHATADDNMCSRPIRCCFHKCPDGSSFPSLTKSSWYEKGMLGIRQVFHLKFQSKPKVEPPQKQVVFIIGKPTKWPQ